MLLRFVVLIAAALPLAAADNNIQVVEEIAAKVNGDIVTRGELEETLKEFEKAARAEGLAGAKLQEALKTGQHDALRERIDELLLVQKAKDMPNINVDGDLARFLAQIQTQYRLTDADKLAAFVQDTYGITLEELKQRKKSEFLSQRIVSQEVASRVIIPEADLRKYYDEHKSEFVREEQVYLSQILVSTDGKTPQQVAEAEKRAKDLVSRARAGEKFAELAEANSDDTETSKNGGFLPGGYKKTDLRKEIADLVFSQKKGYISDPLKIPNPPGFLILKVEERYEAGQASFDEVKEQIQQFLAGPKVEPKLREYLTKLRLDAYLEIKDGYVDSGAAPGKDTSWHDVAEIKPQTTTKEETAARRKKKFLGVVPYGRVGPVKAAEGADAPPAPPPAQNPPSAAAPVQK
ncbi:MAG: peptidyl-prolyl cis-trans isomerase [Bryobacteraceae bacterium]|jgi:parvulin-like peptidyl-prolyl isomerase